MGRRALLDSTPTLPPLLELDPNDSRAPCPFGPFTPTFSNFLVFPASSFLLIPACCSPFFIEEESPVGMEGSFTARVSKQNMRPRNWSNQQYFRLTEVTEQMLKIQMNNAKKMKFNSPWRAWATGWSRASSREMSSPAVRRVEAVVLQLMVNINQYVVGSTTCRHARKAQSVSWWSGDRWHEDEERWKAVACWVLIEEWQSFSLSLSTVVRYRSATS